MHSTTPQQCYPPFTFQYTFQYELSQADWNRTRVHRTFHSAPDAPAGKIGLGGLVGMGLEGMSSRWLACRNHTLHSKDIHHPCIGRIKGREWDKAAFFSQFIAWGKRTAWGKRAKRSLFFAHTHSRNMARANNKPFFSTDFNRSSNSPLQMSICRTNGTWVDCPWKKMNICPRLLFKDPPGESSSAVAKRCWLADPRRGGGSGPRWLAGWLRK